ncbi:hypothetical protein [Georgenia thermotolerans]|uniref:CU044_5270 family protein n=1 Tax=Georgenia thermotolerans TaxID=527326 RepID=A0A7J5UUR6_9MICO|nr:hypothetical protein [Georgenia thermotolerans]KAE8766041.1 hypothetical protein GB883_01145 [Georgenia thermotolerans]
MTPERTVLAQLADLDPTRHEPLADREQVDATLAWVLAHDPVQPEPTGSRPHRRWVALAGAAAALVLGLAGAHVLPGLITGTGSTAAAATVPMLAYAQPEGTPARAELEQLADRVRDAADPPPPDGAYRYLRVVGETWAFVKRSPEGSMEADALQLSMETWVAPDGSIRVLQKDDGIARYGYGDFAPGDFPPPADLSGTPDEIVRRLAAGAPKDEAAYAVLSAYVSSVGLYGAYPAAERSAFLDGLAALDVTSYGTVADRAGRTGLAFGAAHHVPYRPHPVPDDPAAAEQMRRSSPPADLDGHIDDVRVILDPVTGTLLAVEHIQSGVDYLPMDTVTGYTTFLEDTYVATMPECGHLGCGANGPPADGDSPFGGGAARPGTEPITGPEANRFYDLTRDSDFTFGRLRRQPLPDGSEVEGFLRNLETGTEMTFTYQDESVGGLPADLLDDPEYTAYDLPGGRGFIYLSDRTATLRGQSHDGTRTAVVTINAPGAGTLANEDLAFARDVFVPGLLRGSAE